jgi:stage III sporulation protein AD
MEILKLAALILLVVMLINGLPTFSREISILIMLSSCIVVLLYIINMIVPAVEYIREISENISFEGTEIILKAIGIGFVTQFVSDMASDCSNKALANQMIFAGRVTILLLAMPVFLRIFEIIERLVY